MLRDIHINDVISQYFHVRLTIKLTTFSLPRLKVIFFSLLELNADAKGDHVETSLPTYGLLQFFPISPNMGAIALNALIFASYCILLNITIGWTAQNIFFFNFGGKCLKQSSKIHMHLMLVSLCFVIQMQHSILKTVLMQPTHLILWLYSSFHVWQLQYHGCIFRTWKE